MHRKRNREERGDNCPLVCFIKDIYFVKMKIEQRIAEYIDEKLLGTDLFVVDFRILPKSRILILLDGDEGVKIEECAQLSRHVGHRIEEENLIDHAFTLEVSSPGVDHPLVLQRQYPKNIGRNLSVRMNDGKEREGKLMGVKDDKIIIEEKIKEKGKKAYTQEAEILFQDIKETKVIISFK